MREKTSAYEFERYFSPHFFEGVKFFNSKERAQKVAKETRQRFRIKCRSVTIPASGYFGFAERYLVLLPTTDLAPDELERVRLADACILRHRE